MMLYNQTKPITVDNALTPASVLKKGFGFFGIGELNGGHLLVIDAFFRFREVGADWTFALREKNRNVELYSFTVPSPSTGPVRMRMELNCLVGDEDGVVRVTGEVKFPKPGGGFEVLVLEESDLDIDTLSEMAFDLIATGADNDSQLDCNGLMLQWVAPGQQM